MTVKEKEIRELQRTYAKLLDESNRKRELKYVLREALKLHQERDTVMEKTEITSDMGARIRFSRVTGVINTSDRSAFHRLVFRFSRGSCYLRFFDIFEGPDEVSSSSVFSVRTHTHTHTHTHILFMYRRKSCSQIQLRVNP